MWRTTGRVLAGALSAGLLYGAEHLNLAQAIEQASQSHPNLQADSAAIDAATAGLTTARAYPNPQATVTAGRQTARLPGAYAGGDFIYSVAQPLELGDLRPKRLALAERERDTARFVFSDTRLAVIGAVRRAFHYALRRKSEIALAGDNVRRVEDLRRRIRIRVDAGEAGRLELSRAEAETATAHYLAESAQLEFVNALAQLQAAMGTPVAPDTVLEDTQAPAVPLPSLEDLHREAVEQHPALAALRSGIRSSEARVAYETALRRPQPAIYAEIERLPDNPTYRFGVTIPLPVWNKREGPIAEAAAQQRRAAALAEARQIQILAALDGAYGRAQVAEREMSALEQGVLSEAEQALAGAELAYQLGERQILEVLDAQRVLRDVRRQYLDAQYQRQSALDDIEELRAADLRRNNP
jgi:cobalt-zinc-cadmium efflux system outer membrane protein